MIRTQIALLVGDKRNPIEVCEKKYHLAKEDVRSAQIVRQSLDARAKQEPSYLYQIEFDLDHEETYQKKMGRHATVFEKKEYHLPNNGNTILAHRPIIIGFGPSSMACAYALAKAHFRPIIIERGSQIRKRKEDVKSYWNGQDLNEESNVQYGHGGAGAFSDGKLTTRIKDERIPVILDALIHFGADPAIRYLQHPHLGTDVLEVLNERIQKEIEALGGTFYFDTKWTNVITDKGRILGIKTDSNEFETDLLIAGIGHSSLDTVKMLHCHGVNLEPKAFAVGFRVEHLQEAINSRQYRNITHYEDLPPAEYFLSHRSTTGRGVYSFCMCPGGFVIPSESRKETIVTNGMSYSARDGLYANSGILVQVNHEDYGDGLFDGFIYQRGLEEKCYRMGQGKAICMPIQEYFDGSMPKDPLIPTYARGTIHSDLHDLFSSSMNTSFTEFFEYADKAIPGFTLGNGVMTAVESRSSSPIRILRDSSTYESNLSGFYPIGEGAGYAGGIMSSALDGLRAAEAILSRYSFKE